ncbi:cathelicidin-related peptide Bf-CRAMP-like, partial [Pseudonaja textilis]|uniref:cathelicidin-related peptide Bf-CRAMP-like n=1 Tax=Pseudonaja textilis TaxID=8673 RepID=UPI000EAA794A
MEGNFWKTWVVVGTLSFLGASSLPHAKPLTYKEVVALAIYNSRSGEDCVYRLLGASAEPQWDPISESYQELNFTIKETMCLLEDVVFFDECDFKEGGDRPERVKRFLGVFRKPEKDIRKLSKEKEA